MGSRFFCPIAKTTEDMKATTFTPESTAKQSVSALAERVLEFLTSTPFALISGIVALFAVMAAVVNGTWGVFHTVAMAIFAVSALLSMAVSTEEGGAA